jgi:hypothetical protein
MRKKKILVATVGLVVLLLAAVGILGWKYYQVTRDVNRSAAKTSQRITQAVSKIYLVPNNEQPTVAVIQDKGKLGNQEFFKQAQNGDYILVYPKAKVALVYRERTNQLINLGPLSSDQSHTAGVQTNSGATDTKPVAH